MCRNRCDEAGTPRINVKPTQATSAGQAGPQVETEPNYEGIASEWRTKQGDVIVRKFIWERRGIIYGDAGEGSTIYSDVRRHRSRRRRQRVGSLGRMRRIGPYGTLWGGLGRLSTLGWFGAFEYVVGGGLSRVLVGWRETVAVGEKGAVALATGRGVGVEGCRKLAWF